MLLGIWNCQEFRMKVRNSDDIPNTVILFISGWRRVATFLIWNPWTSSEVYNRGRRWNRAEKEWKSGSYALCQNVPLTLSSTAIQCLWKPPLSVHSAMWMFQDKWWGERWCGKWNSNLKCVHAIICLLSCFMKFGFFLSNSFLIVNPQL